MKYDLYNNLHIVNALNPASKTAGENGATIDLLGYQSIMFVVTVGAIATADGSDYLALTIQTSDDGTNWNAAISDPNGLQILSGPGGGVIPNIDGVLVVANSTMKFGLTGTSLMHRYVRIVSTKTGTETIIMGVIAILGFARHAPSA